MTLIVQNVEAKTLNNILLIARSLLKVGLVSSGSVLEENEHWNESNKLET
jgi:hypothetical protein